MKLLETNQSALSWGFLILVFIIFCTASFIGAANGKEAQYINLGEVFFFSFALWLFLLALVRQVWVFLLIVLPAALLAPVEIWFRMAFDHSISLQPIALALETSLGEATNFFLSQGIGLAMGWTAWVLGYLGIIWLAHKNRLVWQHRSFVYCLCIVPAIVLILYVQYDMPPWIRKIPSSDAFDGKVSEGWSQKWEEIFPVNIAIALQQYELEKKKISQVQADLKHQSMGGRLTTSESVPEVVVLVLGESSTPVRWGLMGYLHNTTPRLSIQANLVAFSNVVGVSTSTRTAVPGALSRRPVLGAEGSVDAKAEPSLVKAFAEAGYRTHWFSNQSPFGEFDTSIAVYAREAEDVRFLNPSTFRSRGNLDEVLLAPLKAVLETPGRHLVVLHTLGSHFDYSLRYPEKFDRFTPSLKNLDLLKQTISDAEEKKRVGNAYDNSILYTDYVLAEVIDSVKRRGGTALVSYFSDHGVDLPSQACPYLRNSRQEESAFRVPVLFWFSDEMREKRAADWARLSINRTQPFTTRAMFSTLLELASIDITGGLPASNFLRTPEVSQRSRLVAVGSRIVDFDQARAKNACYLSGK